MNYLAHAYLSFDQPSLLAGNMISDFVKGRKQFDYPPAIQQGIRLHRAIDAFTDGHEITKQAKQYLKSAVGAYAGAFIDVVYDHYLALDRDEFENDAALQTFAIGTYNKLDALQDVLPEKFSRMLPYMRQHNWLYSYRFTWGIEKSFDSVARRAKYLSSYKNCFELFEKHYVALQLCYQAFFPLLKKYSAQFLETDSTAF